MGYSTVGKGLFHCQIWGIPVRDIGYSVAGYRVFHCWIGVFHMGYVIIGSDIEYIKLEDTHSYLDEIFPKLNTTKKKHSNLLYNLCCFVLSWLVLFWGRWVSWVGVLS